jgi:Uma2 family endonuclease
MKAMVMPARGSKRIAINEFLSHADELSARAELIDGRVVRLSCGGGAQAQIAERVALAFRRKLQGRPWRTLAAPLVPVDRWNALRPDVAVAFADRERAPAGIVVEPVIAVEVVAPEIETAVRGAKWLHYREIQPLQHLLLLAGDVPRAELFSRKAPSEWVYRSYEDGLHRMIELSALDICLLLAEIYEGVDLSPAGRR